MNCFAGQLGLCRNVRKVLSISLLDMASTGWRWEKWNIHYANNCALTSSGLLIFKRIKFVAFTKTGADSSSTSMEVEDSPASSHDDLSKPIRKRCRLLQKHRVDGTSVEEAVRAILTNKVLIVVKRICDR